MSAFNKLNIQRIVSDEERNNIYQTSEILLKNGGTRYDDIIKLLETTMDEETYYYVIHDYELVKGKLKKLLGTVVIARKKDIISFVSNEIESKDITEMRIIPYVGQEYCIFISEHEIAYLHNK